MEIGTFIDGLRMHGHLPSVRRVRYDANMTIAGRYLKEIGMAMIKDFVIDDKNRFTYWNILKWLYADPSAMCIDPVTHKEIPADPLKGIYIGGPTGTGKSVCLKVFQMFARIDNIQIEFMGGSGEMVKYFIFGCDQFRADEICDDFMKTGSLESYKRSPILTINDMGSEQSETMFMGNRVNCLRSIIEYRGDQYHNNLTFITSNNRINDDDNLNKYGDRVVSRLVEMCNYYELTGNDRRK